MDPLCFFSAGEERGIDHKDCVFNCVLCFGLCCTPVSLLQGHLSCNDPVSAPWGMSINARKKLTAPGLGIGSLEALNDVWLYKGSICIL